MTRQSTFEGLTLIYFSDAMFSVTSALIFAHSKIARVQKNCSLVATNGNITNFRFIAENTCANDARVNVLVEERCRRISKNITATQSR